MDPTLKTVPVEWTLSDTLSDGEGGWGEGTLHMVDNACICVMTPSITTVYLSLLSHCDANTNPSAA